MFNHRILFFPVLAAVAASFGCAGSIPQQLQDARQAYQHAEASPAATVDPAQLHVAKDALVLAEKVYDDEGDSANARDRAYVAMRKAQLAEVQATTITNERMVASTNAHAATDEKNELTADRAKLIAQQQQLAAQQAQLQAEEQRRMDAEKRAMQALALLAANTQIKQEPRGVVITLSGSVLFASNKSELLASAKQKLTDVANALVKSDPDGNLVVEGHADSSGDKTKNQELSEKRAQSVRDFLVAHGLKSEHVTAQGIGSDRPVATNDTPEGRANNRRVEIIVEPQASGTPSTAGGSTGSGTMQGSGGSGTSSTTGSSTTTPSMGGSMGSSSTTTTPTGTSSMKRTSP